MVYLPALILDISDFDMYDGTFSLKCVVIDQLGRTFPATRTLKFISLDPQKLLSDIIDEYEN